ncbi:hypothetical protein [Porticoccus sp.]
MLLSPQTKMQSLINPQATAKQALVDIDQGFFFGDEYRGVSAGVGSEQQIFYSGWNYPAEPLSNL